MSFKVRAQTPQIKRRATQMLSRCYLRRLRAFIQAFAPVARLEPDAVVARIRLRVVVMHLDNLARNAFGKSFASPPVRALMLAILAKRNLARETTSFLYEAFARFSRRACVAFTPVK
jgi:hypothetical protein